MLRENTTAVDPSDQTCRLSWREVNLESVAHNVKLLAARCAPAQLMVVVKADAYSHGAVAVARTALGSGATRLGVATLDEAFELRRHDITAPVLAWLAAPESPYADAIRFDIEVAAHSIAQLERIAQAARRAGSPATVHLKAETGMWRGGAAGEWSQLTSLARQREEDGLLRVVGVWSHLACADTPDDPANDAQLESFTSAVRVALDVGLRPRLRHLANSAATLSRPDMHFDMVRCGLAVYGVDPFEQQGRAPSLRQAMTVRAVVTQVKDAPVGTGVCYSHTYRTRSNTKLAIVPIGYADGVPVIAGTARPVGYRGTPVLVAGRVCMDQLVLDVGELPMMPGDEVTIFGPGDDGEHTAAKWAELTGLSTYAMLTGFARRRVPIQFTRDPAAPAGAVRGPLRP